MTLKEHLAIKYANETNPVEEFATSKLAFIAGFETAKKQVLEILREVGDLGDGDYIWTEVSELGELDE